VEETLLARCAVAEDGGVFAVFVTHAELTRVGPGALARVQAAVRGLVRLGWTIEQEYDPLRHGYLVTGRRRTPPLPWAPTEADEAGGAPGITWEEAA
jgi:hypothetical protein